MNALRKLGLILGLALLCAASARAQSVAVSGNLKDLGVNNATQQNTYVLFTLQNFGSNIPRVIGTNAIVSANSPAFRPDASGNISGNIQSNDSISPANTFYRVCVYFRGVQFQCNNYLIDFAPPGGPTWNLNSATPITSVIPPPVNPAPVNQVFAGPPSGAPNTPGFRALVGADLPTPAPTSLGGLFSFTGCPPGNHLNSITTIGGVTCTPDASGGGASLAADNIWTSNNRFKGSDPWADITAYGVIGFRPGVISPTDGSTTVTCTSGSPNVSIGSTVFANTAGVTLQGCGATNTMSTPSAPTVTPIYAKGGTRTHNTVNSPTGSSTYQYLFVAADQGGGLTLPSPATTITTGLASLGLQTIGISATSRSNDTVTVTTASPVSLVAGQAVEILGVPGNSFDGWFLIGAVSDSTHFTLTSTETDSRNQTAFITDQTSAGSGGTLAWYSGNKMVLAAATTGAIRYYVCGERPGDVAFHVIGQTMISDATTTYTDLQFEDWGSTYMANQFYPFYVTDAICSAASATNDQLTTTIVSGGGTTNLVLAANAGNNSVAGAKIVFDAVPNILAAANSAAKTNGVIYIPPVCNSSCVESFPINSYLKLPAGVSIFQAGSLVLGETIESTGNLMWDGSWANFGAAQFGTGGGAKISAISGNPALHLTGVGNNLKWVSMTSSVNGSTFIVADNATTDIANTQLVTDGLASTDTLGMDIVYRDTTNTINDHSMDHSLISGGPDQVNDKSWTPLMWLAPCIANGCNTGYEVQLHYINFSERGVEIDGKGNCPILTTDWTYNQGNITPQFLVGPGCSFNGYAKFIHARLDTTGEPYLANLTLGGNFVFDFTSGGSTPNQPLISGFRPTSTAVSSAFTDGNAPLSDVNRGLDKQFPFAYLTAYPFDTTGSFLPTLQPFHLRSEPDVVVGGYSKYWVLPPPTSITEAVSAGGSVPTGTWIYSVSATGIDNGETIMQPTPSSVATTTGGNQTVTVGWTPTVGAVTYNIFRCNTGSSTCTTGGVIGQSSGWVRLAQHQTGVSYVDSAATGTAVNIPSVTATGVSGMNDKETWSPLFGCPETSAPAGVATWDLFYCDATDHRLKLINNNGAASDVATLADISAANSWSSLSPGTNSNAGTFAVSGNTWDFGGAAHTSPSLRGTAAAIPATCAVGEEYFATNATPGQNKYFCTATNVWTQQLNSGASGANQQLGNLTGTTAINLSLFPSAVNTAALGSQALPFTNLCLGTVANQAACFDTSSLSANRTIKLVNAAMVIPQSIGAVSHNFLTALSGTTGAFTQAQPTLADIGAGVAAAGLYDFSGGNIKLPQGAGFTATGSNNVGIDTTANALHGWIGAADAIVAGFASAPAGSKCVQTSGTVGLEIEASLACGTWTDSSTNGPATNKTISQEGSGNVITTVATGWFRAAGCNNNSPSPSFDLATTNSPTPNCLTGTNVLKATLDYDDSANEFSYFDLGLPHTWTGAIDINLKWLVTASGGSNAVKWTVATACSADASSFDTAFNAPQTITTNVAANNVQTVSSQTTLTVTGCAVDNVINFKVGRDTSDTFTGTARLIAAQIIYRHTGK